MASHLFATKPLKQLLEEMQGESRLRRVLGPVQLTSLGVGAVIGTGIFILTGQAAHDKAGPALILSFVAYFDLPAIVITALVTIVLVKGIKESASINTGIVIVKLAIVLFVIAVGAFYIDTHNWTDNFAPYGYTGVSFLGKTILGQ